MYKGFYIEELETSYKDIYAYVVYARLEGWFKKYKRMGTFNSFEEAEDWIKRARNYPRVTSRTYYNADGTEDLMW